MEMRPTAPVGMQPVSHRDEAHAANTALRGARTKDVALPATLSPAHQQAAVRADRRAGGAHVPGATAAFTARQAQLNADVTAAQRALAFVDAASGQLRGLKGALGAMLGGAPHSGIDAAARIARFDALWGERPARTDGMLDAQLAVRPAGDATRTFRLRALNVEQWRSGGAETLMFHPTGLGKQAASISFEGAPIDAAAFARKLDRALAATGVRASLAADGQVDFSVAESRWPAVRDHLMVQGGGKRFPGGRPSRAQAEAAPEAIVPAGWRVTDRTAQRAALRDTVRALDGLMQADRALRGQIDTVAQRLRTGTSAPAGAQATQAAQLVSGALAEPADFNVLSVVTSTLSGLSRARVETLLKC